MRRLVGPLFTLGLVLLAVLPALFSGWERLIPAAERWTLDQRYAWRGAIEPGGEVVLVTVDDATLAQEGAWPLPRARLGDALLALRDLDARVVAIDLLLTEPREGDSALTMALASGAPSLIAYAFDLAGEFGGETTGRSEDLMAFALPVVRISGNVAAVAARGVLMPTPAIAQAAGALGHVSLVIDTDGRVREHLAAIAYDGLYYPSLPVLAAAMLEGHDRGDIALDVGRGLTIGDRRIDIHQGASVLVNHYGRNGTIETLSMADLLAGRLARGAIAGRLVFLGVSATGLGDRFATPLAPSLPGVEHLATVADNILTDRLLARPPWLIGAEAGITVLLMLAIAATRRRGPLLVILATLVAIAAIAGAAQYLFATAHMVTAMALPTLLIIAAGLVSAVVAATGMERRRRQASDTAAALSAYVPRFARAGNKGQPVENRTAMVGVLFVDLVGFTSASERQAPDVMENHLRRFHRAIEAAAEAHGGAIDKYVGDGAMAVFGLERDAADVAISALAAARDMTRDAAAADMLPPETEIAVGVHCGYARIGVLGGETLRQVSLTGDTVNTASRLESLTRSFATRLIVSQAVVEAARAFAREDLLEGLESIGEQPIRGRAQKMTLWRLRRTGEAESRTEEESG